jgi:hypothetical protein
MSSDCTVNLQIHEDMHRELDGDSRRHEKYTTRFTSTPTLLSHALAIKNKSDLR